MISTIFNKYGWTDINDLLELKMDKYKNAFNAKDENRFSSSTAKDSVNCIDFMVTEWDDFETKMKLLVEAITGERKNMNKGNFQLKHNTYYSEQTSLYLGTIQILVAKILSKF